MAWYFGYGSLIWRPGFEYVERSPARLVGYARRFWQGSPDHRGTVAAPGRVVTLIPMPGSDCSGVAYWVDPGRDHEVLAYLDHRESGGYSRQNCTLELADGRSVDAVVYVGQAHNSSFLGSAPLMDIAHQIWVSRGPSGDNLDYLVKLSESLDELGVDDEHVQDLISAVKTFGTPST